VVEVVRQQRKSPVLTPSGIPCLRKLPTINITQGCALGCRYCYIQGYSQFPGFGRVVLYENTPELLQEERRRKRRLPQRVYFSPSSDAFQCIPDVQEVSFRTMKMLLDAGIEIAFLTKGFVTPRFIELFRTKPPAVQAQIGITTLDERLCMALEPRAAPPEQRLAQIRELATNGVTTTARLDPLIPDLTDCDENLLPLLGALKELGITRVSASYLFLRPAFAQEVVEQIARLRGRPLSLSNWRRMGFLGAFGCGWAMGAAERAARFSRLESLAASQGVSVAVCRCKNPELSGLGCGISGPSSNTAAMVRAPEFDFA
jgi:DNA repair photolyase